MRLARKAIVLIIACLLAGQRLNAEKITVTARNDIPRLDQAGNTMDCHDGCLEYFAGTFYLYGTAYGSSDGFGKTNRYVCYSSKDLTTWVFRGELLKDAPEGVYYRPYVKYNKQTGNYVLWYNWYPKLWDGQYGVAVSKSPTGPFAIRNTNVKVKYEKPGDLGLFVDETSSPSAYLVYTSIKENHGISVERLSADYLSSTLENSGFLAHGCEAPTMFKRNSVYYVLFDVCCCFCPQGSGAQVYTAAKPLGPYSLRGNVNRDQDNAIIIPAQQTHVATLPGDKGLIYIWMGDLWGSRPDGIKGHDLQYWSSPLKFRTDGTIEKLQKEASWTIDLLRF